ncbi:MAG: c-type cytochrome [Thermomicrobiales bacterium]
MDQFDCTGCHTIPGIDGADGTIGPPLNFWSKRSFIAGNLPNEPDNLIAWIMNPQAIEPGTAMPNLDVTEAQARDIAAYLYTLE